MAGHRSIHAHWRGVRTRHTHRTLTLTARSCRSSEHRRSDFALAHAGNTPGHAARIERRAARALAASIAFSHGSPPRGQPPGVLDLAFTGQTDAAIAALTRIWRTARAMRWWSPAPLIQGLIGASGRIGQKHTDRSDDDGLAATLRRRFLVPRLSRHGAVRGWATRRAARPEDRALRWRRTRTTPMARTGSRMSATRAASRTPARAFLSVLAYHLPARGLLLWPSELAPLAVRTARPAIALSVGAVSGRHRARPAQRRAAAENVGRRRRILWRSELAGQPRDADAWRALHEYANSALPRPGSGLADLHVILAQAVMGDDAALDARARPNGSSGTRGALPVRLLSAGAGTRLCCVRARRLLRERSRCSTPLAGQNERIGGSRAQHDLIEFTLLKACLDAGRLEEARQLLARDGLALRGVPVTESMRALTATFGWRRRRTIRSTGPARVAYAVLDEPGRRMRFEPRRGDADEHSDPPGEVVAAEPSRIIPPPRPQPPIWSMTTTTDVARAGAEQLRHIARHQRNDPEPRACPSQQRKRRCSSASAGS